MSTLASEPAVVSAPLPLREKAIAAAVHLLLSGAAVGALLLLVMRVWYPEFLFRTDGGWQGLRIVVLVDLVLGPLLTFVVYRRGKKGLRLDLALIGLLQVIALLGGGWVVYAERPLALVFHEGRIFSVTADNYRDAGMPVPDLSGLPGRPPDFVVLRPPANAIEQSPVRTAYLGRRQFIYTHVPWMRDAASERARVLAAAVAPDDLAPTFVEEWVLDRWLEANDRTADEVAFLPYSSRFRMVHLVMDRRSGRLLGALDISSG